MRIASACNAAWLKLSGLLTAATLPQENPLSTAINVCNIETIVCFFPLSVCVSVCTCTCTKTWAAVGYLGVVQVGFWGRCLATSACCGEAGLFLCRFFWCTFGVAHEAHQHLTTSMVCALLGQPDVDTFLHTQRLRYLRQLATGVPDVIWALLSGDAEYMAALRSSLK